MCSRQHIIKTFPAFKIAMAAVVQVSRGDFIASLCLPLVWSSTRESVCWRARQGACTVDSGSELAKTYARPHIGFLISKAFRILSIGHLFSIAVIQQCGLAARDSLSWGEWMDCFKSGSWRGFILLEAAWNMESAVSQLRLEAAWNTLQMRKWYAECRANATIHRFYTKPHNSELVLRWNHNLVIFSAGISIN